MRVDSFMILSFGECDRDALTVISPQPALAD
jgi:hypothetical protein